MVPVGMAQVGWVVVLAVGTAGTAGTALTVVFAEEAEIQVLSALFLAVNVCTPGATPAKVVDN